VHLFAMLIPGHPFCHPTHSWLTVHDHVSGCLRLIWLNIYLHHSALVVGRDLAGGVLTAVRIFEACFDARCKLHLPESSHAGRDRNSYGLGLDVRNRRYARDRSQESGVKHIWIAPRLVNGGPDLPQKVLIILLKTRSTEVSKQKFSAK